jgi:tetratricopeptide (TPR) repeat protein
LPEAERTCREELEGLYDRARMLDPDARRDFLETACRADPGLREEVTLLLAVAANAESFFERLSASVHPGSDLVREAMLGSAAGRVQDGAAPGRDPLVGRTISQFRIISEIGRGGMGMVYRAHDTRLNRDVALKFLPPHLTAQVAAEEHLLAEARAAAALEHPNVCTIHDIHETDDGRPFIAMALCDGETLKARLRRRPLSLAESVGTVTQIARGLAAAHKRGIVHRDVKPGNVMLTADGTVKLLDFGLARVTDLTQTLPGAAQGTVAYMSPEQVRDDELDQRADLWSLGVVFHEMLTGVRPFRGGSDRAVLQAILYEDPEPVTRGRTDVPEALGRVVDRLLQKDPNARYGGATELLADLEGMGPSAVRSGPGTSGRRRAAWTAVLRRPSARLRVLGITAVGVAVVLLVAFLSGRDTAGGSSTVATAAAPALAVLPFSVHGEGLGVWREGMVDLLSTGLDGAGGLRAIASRTVIARWEEEVGDGASADLALSLRVARRTGASHALVGSVVAAGPEISFMADVYDLGSGRAVGQAQVQGSPDSVLNLVDRLGIRVLGVLLEEEPGAVRPLDLASVTTSSLPALKAYLEGEARYRRSDYRGAIEAWERAVGADTLFALAYVGLADAYGWSTADPSAVHRTLDRALHLADRLPPRRADLVRAKSAGWRRLLDKISITEQAVREYPDDAEAWFELGEAYYHQAGAMRGPEEAERAFRRAAELLPTSAPYRAHLLDLAFGWQPDSARVAAELEVHDRLAGEGRQARAGRIAFGFAFGDPTGEARARAALDSVDSETAAQVYMFLRHPRFAAEREAVFSAVDGRLGERDHVLVLQFRFRDLGITEGRVGDALALRDDPAIPEDSRHCAPWLLWNQGSTTPERILDETLASFRVGDSSFTRPFPVNCAALYAADRGRWGDHAALLAHAQQMAGRSFAEGDTIRARTWEEIVREQEAHRLWGRGRKAEALRAFEEALALDAQAAWVLWSVGRLALELGQSEKAERAYRRLATGDDFAGGPLGYLHLGRIYERTGRPAEAMAAYDAFASAWQRADPELQPLVGEAREAMARLLEAEG